MRRTAVHQETGEGATEEEAVVGVAAAAIVITVAGLAAAAVLSMTAAAVGQAVAGWTVETAWAGVVARETATLA